MMRRSFGGIAVSVFLCLGAAACSKTSKSAPGNGGGGSTSTTATVTTVASTTTGSSTGAGMGMGGGIGFGVSSGAEQGFDVEPTPQQSLAVTVGATPMTITYTATDNGFPALNTGWGVDQGNIGTVPNGPSSSATFTPSGTAGGLVTITASLNGMTAQRLVMVNLSASQNGATAGNAAEAPQIVPATGASTLTQGGGVGGVGGEGLGVAVTDAPTLTALGAPTGNGQAQGLSFLYPYDKTVWPRGLPAPLLQWTWSTGDADAIQIALSTTSGSFSYTGTFGRPAVLGSTGGKFIRHPIPQDIWAMATNSASGPTDQLTVRLTVAKGGVAYGPISETWTIADTRLAGTIYYQSYGTQLVQNFPGAVGGNGLFGAAVLSIHVGDTGPKVVAGTAAMSPTGCRVCHAVASRGSTLVAVDGNNEQLSSAYALGTTPATETVMGILAEYPAMYPDGSTALTASGTLLKLPAGTTTVATTGLTSAYSNLGQPAFSPDGTMLAFNPLNLSVKPNQTLYVMAYNQATNAFSNPTLVADDSATPLPVEPGWPAFFPDSHSVVYHHQTLKSIEDNLATRAGSHAQIYWTSINSPSDVTPLNNLNGVGYLPKLAAPSTLTCTADGNSVAANPTSPIQPNLDHSDDVDMNYEPTVNPIAGGGYAWVVFTSRRMYGNVATIPPFCSDPRGVDLINNITTKKLWVAAVDLNQKAGVDSSHPAFYLPSQELLAGNARGFWVLDPCLADGTSCSTGDQCCNGFCEPNGTGGALVCSSTAPAGSCSGIEEKCTTAANCCDATNLCVNGFCVAPAPQ